VGSDTTQNVMSDLANVITQGTASVTGRQRTSQISTFTVTDPSPFQVNQIVQTSGVAGFNGTARVLSVTATAITTTASPASPDVAFATVSGGTVTVSTDYPAFSVYARSSGVATLYVSAIGSIVAGDTITVYGLDATFSGDRIVTSTSGNTLSYASAGSEVPATSLASQGQVFRSAQRAISSWDATGTGSFQTRAAVACTYTRAEANGSGAGRSRLLESLTAGNARSGCLDFSRSSSGKGTLVTTPSLTWIPFANDDATYVARSDGGVPRALALADIISAYKCTLQPDINPVLPQTGSGSRSFWLGVVGITEAQITAGTYPCLTGAGTTASRAYLQENDARQLKTDEIMPFSVGLYNTQVSGVNADNRGNAVLGQIDSVLPTGLATAFPVRRSLYNVIPTAKLATAPWSTVFVGSGSLVCNQAATVTLNGFAPLSATSTPVCGDSSSQS
jgi:hypothetical protein